MVASPNLTARRHWHAKGRAVVFSPEPEPAPGRLNYVTRPLDRRTAHELAAAIGGTTYLAGHHPVVRADDGTYVTEAASWFGQANMVGDRAHKVAAACWNWLHGEIRRQWGDDGLVMLATPGTLGRDLWLRTVPARGWPVMSDAAQKLVRDTSGQARVQVMPAAAETVPALCEYDMTLAYAAVLRGLPVGEPQRIRIGGQLVPPDVWADVGMTAARWLVTFMPPRGWDRPGILGVRDDGGAWRWPTAHENHGPTWADGCEVDLAMRHGWTVLAHEALIWPTRDDPLRLWRERLLRIERAGRVRPGLQAFMARAAVRALLLHTIGAMHGRPYRAERHGSPDEAPDDADMIRLYDDGTASWVEEQAPRWPETSHPEWSAHIWSRARARVLSGPNGTGVLNLPAGKVVAIRTDAVYTTGPCGWEIAAPAGERDRPGTWTLRRGPASIEHRWPATASELLAVRGG